jgi:hypothetical protein
MKDKEILLYIDFRAGNEEKRVIHRKKERKKEEEKVENRRKCGSGRNEGIKDKTGRK